MLLMLIIASATVLALHHETDIYSFRFGIPMDLSAYLLLVCPVLARPICLHGVGVYHRHVMGDGYQLNALLIKGAVIAVMVTCAFDFIMRIGMSLTAIVLSFVFGLLLTMVERFFMRLLITQGRRKGRCSCSTVVVGSQEGRYARSRSSGKKQQLELSAGGSMLDTAIPQRGWGQADTNVEGLDKQINDVLDRAFRS